MDERTINNLPTIEKKSNKLPWLVEFVPYGERGSGKSWLAIHSAINFSRLNPHVLVVYVCHNHMHVEQMVRDYTHGDKIVCASYQTVNSSINGRGKTALFYDDVSLYVKTNLSAEPLL
jgi:hypothetical protein